MSKRFTYNAGQATGSLADVQRKIARRRRELSALEAEERGLKAFLGDFYDLGETEILIDNQLVEVTCAETERFIIDQDKVTRFYNSNNKRVPYKRVVISTLKAKVK
jgi:hypothetical protein